MRLTMLQKFCGVRQGWQPWPILAGSFRRRTTKSVSRRLKQMFSARSSRLPTPADRLSQYRFQRQVPAGVFGFTNCPDVCPTTLSEVAAVMDGLGSDADRVQPLFISVDPERDRRLSLAEFTGAFHPSIIGLAGTEAETRAAADSFKIFYERDTDASAPDGYTMSHSPALYLVGPEGDWLRLFDYGTPAIDILADLQSRL